MATSVRWVMLNDVESLNFIHKDVIVAHNSIFMVFYNLTNHTELVYTAQDENSGDGIECFIGHKSSYVFAFAEKSNHANILMMTYPEFKIMFRVKDDKIKKFTSLEFMDGEYILALSNDPNNIIVWSWRMEQKLIVYDIGIENTKHILKSCPIGGLFCYFWDDTINVFEIIPIYKACLLQSRSFYKENVSVVDLTWTNDGNLFIIDKNANVYSVVIDGVHVLSVKEWSTAFSGEYVPMMTYYKNGLVIFGPNLVIQHLKKNKEWSTVWSCDLEWPILKMISSSGGENLIMVNDNGEVIKMQCDNDNVIFNIVTIWRRNITMIDLIYPNCEEIVTLHSDNMLCIWKCNTGILRAKISSEDDVSFIKTSIKKPISAVCKGFNGKNGVSLINMEKNVKVLSSICLSKCRLDKMVWSDSEEGILVSAMNIGELFYLKISENSTITVIYYINTENILKDTWIISVDEKILIFALIDTGKIICYDGLERMKVEQVKDSIAKVACYKNSMLVYTDGSTAISFFELILKDNVINFEFKSNMDISDDIKGMFIKNKSFHYWNKNVIKIFKIDQTVEQTHRFIATHKYGVKIKAVISDVDNSLTVALIDNGDLIFYSLKKQTIQRQSGRIEKIYKKDMIENSTISKVFSENSETWTDHLLNIKDDEESNKWYEVRSEIEAKYNILTEKLTVLLDENESVDRSYRLPMSVFRMHPEGNRMLFGNAAKERELVKVEFENKIKSQDEIAKWIKTECWDSMETLGIGINAIFSDKSVENYPLTPLNREEESDQVLYDSVKVVERERSEMLFLTWKDLLETKIESNLGIRQASSNLSFIVEVNTDDKIEDDTFSDFTESTAKHFIEPEKFISSQMLAHTFIQMNWIANKIKKTTKRLQEYFNEKFEEVMRLKQKEISSIVTGNMRLRVIVAELNSLNKLRGSEEVIVLQLEDPQWSQNEVPEKLITVEPNEIGVSPYISIDDIEKSTSIVMEKDPFYERALMEMMDGALEKLWEDEIKKPIQKPQCMLEKCSEEYTESDLAEINEWKEKIKLQEAETERYKTMLCSEFDELSAALNERINSFNGKVDELYLLKLKVESAIGQEELKMMLLREHNSSRIEAAEKYKELECEMVKLEAEQDQIYDEMNVVQHQIAESHAVYETLASRDRMMDKNFKTNLGDVSPTALDLCYKLFKKRPKWQNKTSMTVGVLYEMASASLVKERPPFIHHDCLEYLKGIDLMDSVNNMPTMIDETVWSTLCKLRRMKIDNEIKMRAATVEMTEVEAAYATCQKRMNSLRMYQQKLKNDISNHRMYMEKQTKNIPIQLIVKSGLVEIQMTGHIKDFEDAILIKKEEVEATNMRIRKAAQRKVNAERATLKFKKRIIEKEWEHAKLKMKIKHLEDDLKYSERIKVTKEIQLYIQDKMKRHSDVDIEKKIQATKTHFDKQLLDNMRQVEELELKLGSIRTQIESLDNLINQLNMDIGKSQQVKDEAEKRQQDVTKRVNLFIAKTKLMSDIERQHSTILLLRTEVELQRLRTYPTLSAYQTY